ncbi:hypothetical protein N7533_003551 [Penicillium manginii]|uniref:uncharacterized protein n=1 Tax=Penicillium manginii TaxID=203109 RepID=UPI0025469A40|nr:uncharacterized protein N7533_003551 [Penicillium manginii]KAJ5761512.1 hypothetical protein N7533_003551 [Penicillium manginii]
MTTMGNRLRHLRKRRNDTIAIDLCEDAFNTTHSRTTGEEICGWVWIRTGSRLSPGMLEIVFRGRSRVENNAILQPVRTYRQRNFLEMKQPIEKDDFTPYDALKNGFLYRFPFTFIVPGKLPIHACCHDGKFWNALNSHLVLPPSIERSSDNKNMSRFDDMCPENINIAYAVEATVASERAGDFRSKEPWNFASKKITIIPLSKRIDYLDSFDDLISSLPPSKFFAAQKKQTTELHLEYVAATSATIFLPLQHNTKDYTTIIPVKVTFESNHGGVPPKLSRISRKLVAHTTAKAVPFRASDSGPMFLPFNGKRAHPPLMNPTLSRAQHAIRVT